MEFDDSYEERNGAEFVDEFLEEALAKEDVLVVEKKDLGTVLLSIAPGLAKADSYVRSMLADFVAGKSCIVPAILTKFKNEFDDYCMSSSEPLIADSILYLAPHTLMAAYSKDTGLWSRISISFPLDVATVRVTHKDFETMNFYTNAGIVPFDVDGPVLDYVVKKYDGVRVVVGSAVGVRKGSIVIAAGVTEYYDQERMPFVFEKVGKTGYVRRGYYENVVTNVIMVNHEAVKLVETVPLTRFEIERFSLDDKGCDGLIVSLNGIEKKIKHINTVELRFDGLDFVDGHGGKFLKSVVVNDPGIYEVRIHKNIVVTAKKRLDKLSAQKFIGDILAAPTVGDFQYMMKGKDFLVKNALIMLLLMMLQILSLRKFSAIRLVL